MSRANRLKRRVILLSFYTHLTEEHPALLVGIASSIIVVTKGSDEKQPGVWKDAGLEVTFAYSRA